MKNLLTVGAPPHFHAEDSIRRRMATVILALLPVAVFSVVSFGWRALVLLVVTVLSCVGTETLFCAVLKKKNTASDLSSVVSGLLLAFCLPVTTPYLAAVAGGVFAIAVVKLLFGGLGRNFLNPALAARAFLYTFSSLPVVGVAAFSDPKVPVLYDGLFGWKTGFVPETGEELLSVLKAGELPRTNFADILMGNTAGNLGETCLVLLAIGGVFLILRGIVSWQVPLAFLGGTALCAFLFPYGGQTFSGVHVLLELCGGGTVLAAFFLATDPVTGPVTGKGRLLYGFLCGVLTVVFRRLDSVGDGVTFAILLMNLFAVAFDRLTAPRRYGRGGEKKHG